MVGGGTLLNSTYPLQFPVRVERYPQFAQVTFHQNELVYIYESAKFKINEANSRNLVGNHGFNNGDPEARIKTELLGITSELAVAHFLGVSDFRPMMTGRGQPDIGSNIDVKSVEDDSRRLLVHLDSNPNFCYVSTVVDITCAQFITDIRGWAWGHEVQDKQYLRTAARAGSPPYYLYPTHLLKSPYEIPYVP